MLRRITLLLILFFFLRSAAVVDAQSGSPHNQDSSFDPVLATLICVFLLVGCCSIIVRHCYNMTFAARATANCSSSGPQGLDPELLNTFPILVYSAVKHLKFGETANECAVCLCEFDQHDTLRLLPKCNHVFHAQCIDAWLASHVTCPVCRRRLRPAEDHDAARNEVVIIIPSEVNAYQMFGESSESRTELNSGDLRSLGRSHSTGHSLGFGEIVGKNTETYTLRILEDVKKPIKMNHGGMRRSASYDLLGERPGEQKSREHLIL